MTITEQLQFSVLTAPVASLDRRALSQAWYSALYGSARGNAGANTPPQVQAQTGTGAQPHGHATTVGPNPRRALLAQGTGKKAYVQPEGMPADRRAPRSTLARKIERVLLKPHTGAQKRSFTVEGAHGRVHVLLQSRGAQLQLIAICPPKARAQVCAALAQARYALALRGIDLDAAARSAQAC